MGGFLKARLAWPVFGRGSPGVAARTDAVLFQVCDQDTLVLVTSAEHYADIGALHPSRSAQGIETDLGEQRPAGPERYLIQVKQTV